MAEISKDADGEAERNGLSTDFTDGTDFSGVLGVSCWQMVPMPQIPEGLASLSRCSIRVHPCHPWLVNPVHERGWTTDLTDGHGSEARELSADGADFQGYGWGSGTGRLSTDFTDDTDSGTPVPEKQRGQCPIFNISSRFHKTPRSWAWPEREGRHAASVMSARTRDYPQMALNPESFPVEYRSLRIVAERILRLLDQQDEGVPQIPKNLN